MKRARRSVRPPRAPAPRAPAGPRQAGARAQLEALGFRPSKRLGQNLLQDANMARAIARDAQVGAGDVVLEIGPGAGMLTAELAALGVLLLAIEIDARLLELARQALASFPSVRWIHGDALASKHAWNPELVAALPAEGPWHLVSNLPYSAASPILAVSARLRNPPRSATVLVQSEVAERIAAPPGGRERGPLGVRLQLAFETRIVRAVPARLFWPRPKVDSSVLRLELLDTRPGEGDWEHLDPLVDALFQHRRQTVGGLLGRLLGSRQRAADLLAAHGVDPGLRPEALPEGLLLELSRSPDWRGRDPRSVPRRTK